MKLTTPGPVATNFLAVSDLVQEAAGQLIDDAGKRRMKKEAGFRTIIILRLWCPMLMPLKLYNVEVANF
jgi:hypothetical protein